MQTSRKASSMTDSNQSRTQVSLQRHSTRPSHPVTEPVSSPCSQRSDPSQDWQAVPTQVPRTHQAHVPRARVFARPSAPSTSKALQSYPTPPELAIALSKWSATMSCEIANNRSAVDSSYPDRWYQSNSSSDHSFSEFGDPETLPSNEYREPEILATTELGTFQPSGRVICPSPASTTTVDPKRLRRQAQNRTAQLKHRQRQRTRINEAEKQVRELNDKLEKLYHSNQALESKAKTLSEKVERLERTKSDQLCWCSGSQPLDLLEFC